MTDKDRRATDRLQDIRESIEHIRDDIGGIGKAQFLADGKTQRAVIESFIVIGEAAGHVMRLAPSLKEGSPEIWAALKDAYDMRNLVAHEYHRVDVVVLWDTVQNDLPMLEAVIANCAEMLGRE